MPDEGETLLRVGIMFLDKFSSYVKSLVGVENVMKMMGLVGQAVLTKSPVVRLAPYQLLHRSGPLHLINTAEVRWIRHHCCSRHPLSL